MDSIHSSTPQQQCVNPDCQKWYPATAEFFYCNKGTHGKLDSQCKKCRLEYLTRPEIREKRAAWARARRKRTPKSMLQRTGKCKKLKVYGLTLEDYNKMLEAQQGVCVVCKQQETKVISGKPQPLSVDHCHTTGKVRGLLCSKCNHALGLLEDNPKRVKSMLDYINKYAS
jgi:hypothetical protein